MPRTATPAPASQTAPARVFVGETVTLTPNITIQVQSWFLNHLALNEEHVAWTQMAMTADTGSDQVCIADLATGTTRLVTTGVVGHRIDWVELGNDEIVWREFGVASTDDELGVPWQIWAEPIGGGPPFLVDSSVGVLDPSPPRPRLAEHIIAYVRNRPPGGPDELRSVLRTYDLRTRTTTDHPDAAVDPSDVDIADDLHIVLTTPTTRGNDAVVYTMPGGSPPRAIGITSMEGTA